MGEPGRPVLTYLPTRRHTHRSEVRTSRLPRTVQVVTRVGDGVALADLDVTDGAGRLRSEVIPTVAIVRIK